MKIDWAPGNLQQFCSGRAKPKAASLEHTYLCRNPHHFWGGVLRKATYGICSAAKLLQRFRKNELKKLLNVIFFQDFEEPFRFTICVPVVNFRLNSELTFGSDSTSIFTRIALSAWRRSGKASCIQLRRRLSKLQ